MKTDVLVVGAGFAGSVITERCATAGMKVVIIDQREHIAGTHTTNWIHMVSWYIATARISSIPTRLCFGVSVKIYHLECFTSIACWPRLTVTSIPSQSTRPR